MIKYTLALATVPGVFGDAVVADSRDVGGIRVLGDKGGDVVPLTATETKQYITFHLPSLTRF